MTPPPPPPPALPLTLDPDLLDGEERRLLLFLDVGNVEEGGMVKEVFLAGEDSVPLVSFAFRFILAASFIALVIELGEVSATGLV